MVYLPMRQAMSASVWTPGEPTRVEPPLAEAKQGRREACLLLALCCGALVAGCRKPEPPKIRPHLARVTGVSAAGIDLEVQLEVFNPNSFPLAAEAVSGTLFVMPGARKLGEGRANPRSAIAAQGSSLVACQVHIGWADMTAVVPLLLSERIPYELRGQVTIGGRTINVDLPFTFTGELDRAELLRAGLRGL